MLRPSSDSTRDSPSRSNQTWITMKSREKNGKWNELLVIRPIIYSLLIMETPPELSVATNRIWFHQSDGLALVILCLFKSNSTTFMLLSICLSRVEAFIDSLWSFSISSDAVMNRWWDFNCTPCWTKCPSGLFAWNLSQNLHQGCLCHLD